MTTAVEINGDADTLLKLLIRQERVGKEIREQRIA
jgi:hypothetical protein